MNKVNLRLFLFCFAAMCCGVFAAVCAIYGQVWLVIVLFATIAVGSVLFMLFRVYKWYIVLTIALFSVVGCVAVYGQLFSFYQREIVEEKVVLTGRVCDIGRNGERTNVLYLEDCVTDKWRLPGRVEVYVYDGSSFATGDTLTLQGTLRSKYVFKSYVDTSALRKHAYYNLQVDLFLSQQSGDLRWDESVRQYVYQQCEKFVGSDSVGVLYALVTGDRNALDQDVYDVFKSTGIAHLLAVSGLHVSVVASVVVFVVKRWRVHPVAELTFVLVPLLFYACVCGFSPSITRAVVMLVCSYLARFLLGKSDLLTSLSIAGIVLLFVQPLYLFDVGFQLSFLSVYGIATLYFALSRLLGKVKFPKCVKWLVNSVAMSVSCFVSTLFCVLTFGGATFAGVVANLFAIPLVSAAFVLALFGLVPFVGQYLLFVADFLIGVVYSAASFVQSVDFTTFAVPVLGLSTLILVVWLFACCGYIHLSRVGKCVCSAICCCLLIASSLFAALPKSCQPVAYVSVGYDSVAVAQLSKSGQAAVVADFTEDGNYSLSQTVDKLYRHDVQSVYWVVPNFNNCQVQQVADYVCASRGDKVIVADHRGNDQVTAYLHSIGVEIVYAYKNTAVGVGVSVTAVYDGALVALLLQGDGLCVAAVVGSEVASSNFAYLRNDVDVYVMRDAFASYAAQNKRTLSLYQTNFVANLGANKYGNFTIRQKNGKISVSVY